MKKQTLYFALLCFAIPILTFSQGKFFGGNGNGFSLTSATNLTLSLDDDMNQGTFVKSTISPNPISVRDEALTFRSSQLMGNVNVAWYDLQGKLIATRVVNKNQPEVKLTLPSSSNTGMYYMLSISSEKSTFNTKVVVSP